MENFNFNDYEKALINACIYARRVMAADGGCTYFATRSLLKKSIWSRLECYTKLTPAQVRNTTDAVMTQIVDNLILIGLPIQI